MLFMGEEWAASTPFYYFCNLGPELAPLVTAGRRDEFKHFSIFRDKKKRNSIPDPCATQTYQASVLNWQEKENDKHKQWLSYYQYLLASRQKNIIPLLDKLKPGSGEYSVLSDNCLHVCWALKDVHHLKMITNLSDQIVPTSSNNIFSNTAKIFFQQPNNFSEKLISGILPPHSVVWYLT
jgi:1,4-alpha-glucan branching enzyme